MTLSLVLLWMAKLFAILMLVVLCILAAGTILALLVYSARYFRDIWKGKIP